MYYEKKYKQAYLQAPTKNSLLTDRLPNTVFVLPVAKLYDKKLCCFSIFNMSVILNQSFLGEGGNICIIMYFVME